MPARSPLRALAAALLAALAALPAAALEPPAEWAAVAGAANVLDHGEVAALGGVEARWGLFRLPLGQRHLPIEPALGLTANDDGGTYAYLSLRLDAAETLAALTGGSPPPAATERRWRLIGFTGLGHYRAGDEGRDLGGPLEFRSGLELSRRIGRRSRLGLSFDHLSNAGLYDSNRGSESLVLAWSWRR
jgi:hypothetical protein